MKQKKAAWQPGGNPLEDPLFKTGKAGIKPVDYAYAAGRIRALETGLMDSARTLRLTEAGDTVEFGRILTEAGYPAAETNGRMLNAGYVRACETACALALEKPYLDVFYREGDTANAKVFIKAMAGPRAESFESLETRIELPAGVPPYRLYEAVRDRDETGADIPDWLWAAVQAAFAAYADTGDASGIDIRLDHAYAVFCAKTAESLGNPWFSRLIAMRSDLVNFGMLLRTRKAGFSCEYLTGSLVAGGLVPPDAVGTLAGLTDEDITAAYRDTPYAALVEGTLADLDRTGWASRYGKAADDLVMRHVREARRIPFGPEVVVAYVYAVRTEVKNARIVLAFLRNHMDPAAARDLLREPYL